MIFVDQMKNLKIYKKPMLLPTLEADKKKHSAIFLLTPNYESSKKLMNHPMIINRKRFESYYLEQDLSYYITGKVSKKVIKEDYIREYNIEDIYHNLCEMTAKERNRLKDNQFGIPSKRKYPLNDEQHVRSAIKFFNYVDKEDEEELANNIIKAINKFNMKVNVGENNRFGKYYQAPVNESANVESEYLEKSDFVVNFDKWNEKNNFLYVTGLSGGGKSTISESIAKKYNATILQLDYITMLSIDDTPEDKRQRIYDKLKNSCPEALEYFSTENVYKVTSWRDSSVAINCKKFLNWFSSKFKGNGKLYVIEGTQLYRVYTAEYLSSLPCIVKGTSLPETLWRRSIRDLSSDIETKGYIESFKKFIRNLTIFTDKKYMNQVDTFNHLLKSIKKYAVTEISNSLAESVDMINTPENPIETAYAIITNHKGEILVQYNTSVNGYHLPGGHVKSGEKLHEGLYRECKEELGIELIEEVKDMEFLYTVEDTYNRGSIFTILNYRGEIQNLEPKYCSDLLWISRDELFNGNVTCSEPLKQYLYKWNQKIEEESINNTTVLSNFIKFSGYSTDVTELSKIVTTDVYYRLLKIDLKLPISSIKDIPIISYEITSRDHGFTSDITSDGNPIIYIKVAPYDSIGSIENYAKDIIRITAISILSSIYPESKDTYLPDILVDDLLGIDTLRREYAKYLFTEITIEDFHSILKSGDIIYIVNLLSRKYPNIRRDDLIKSDISYDYKSKYTNECSIDLSSIYDNIETSYVSESAIEVEDSSYFNEDALSGMDYLKFGDYYTFFDESAANDSQLKLLLYNERIRQRSDLLLLLKKVKEENPVIKYTYPDLEKYLSRNVFLDLYFYNELFFKNNIWKMNKVFNL